MWSLNFFASIKEAIFSFICFSVDRSTKTVVNEIRRVRGRVWQMDGEMDRQTDGRTDR